MKKHIPLLFVTFTLAWLAPAEAQLFSRKPRTPSPDRIGELIVQAKTDQDERKRTAAVGELREFDTRTHPEILSVLVDLARSDSKAGVRAEALSGLARIRPVSQQAGQALEWAASNDESWKVRLQAKSSLLRYNVSGYSAGKKEGPASQPAVPPMTQEPPLLNSRTPAGNSATSIRTVPNNQASAPAAPKLAPPVIVNTIKPPSRAIPTANKPGAASTPPPIIVDGSQTKKEAVATQPEAPSAPIPVVEPAPLPPSTPSEPNFRPAGQAPPRFNTAVPQVPRVGAPVPVNPPPPPPKTESGPVLTPPL